MKALFDSIIFILKVKFESLNPRNLQTVLAYEKPNSRAAKIRFC